MGSYLNPGSGGMRTSLRSKIYVDKTKLIEQINQHIGTAQKFLCVSRPRRFGKSMAAEMLAAYYGDGEDTSSLFDGLKIAEASSYKEHLNQYHVLKINMQEFLSATDSVEEMLSALQRRVVVEFRRTYPEIALGGTVGVGDDGCLRRDTPSVCHFD